MTTCITAVWPYYLPLSSQGVLGKTLVWINQAAYLEEAGYTSSSVGLSTA